MVCVVVFIFALKHYKNIERIGHNRVFATKTTTTINVPAKRQKKKKKKVYVYSITHLYRCTDAHWTAALAESRFLQNESTDRRCIIDYFEYILQTTNIHGNQCNSDIFLWSTISVMCFAHSTRIILLAIVCMQCIHHTQ